VMYQRGGVDIVLFAFRGDHMSLPASRALSRTTCTYGTPRAVL
jgi:hypothetical protein